MLRAILEDETLAPLDRLRALTLAFVRSECAEAQMRLVLADAAPYYRDAPEAQEPRAAGADAIRAFLREALPEASDVTRDVAAALVLMTLSGTGKRISEGPPHESEAHAQGLADMLCGYVARLSTTSAGHAEMGGPAERT